MERIANDLAKHPGIVRKHFGPKASWKTVHPIVLNASFLWLPKSRRGTYFYDASALGRFLKEGTLNTLEAMPVEGKIVHVSKELKRL